MTEARQHAQRVYDHVEKHIGKEAMSLFGHTVERYEVLIGEIGHIGTFTYREAADIMIKILDTQWANLKE